MQTRWSIVILAVSLSLPAFATTWGDGLRSMHGLTLIPGVEISRNFFHLTRPNGPRSARWGKDEEGNERNVGINMQEAEAEIAGARKRPGSHLRWCNVHVHRKDFLMSIQTERKELPPHGNLSFPPSGADVSIYLLDEESWAEWKITGEWSLGVLDFYGLWLFRSLGADSDPKRLALYRKHKITSEEVAAERKQTLDVTEEGRYAYMKAVNARPRVASEILGQPEYRQLVLSYAVRENIELVFVPLEEAVRGDGCRGF